MIVNVVTVHVKPEHVPEFIAATLKNHQGSRREPGNRRFDVLRSDEDPNRFLLYEVFDSQAAVEEHRRTPHYLEWKQSVEAWMTKPREPRWHSILAPLEESAW
jgi:autoinducer 2-degrading protein